MEGIMWNIAGVFVGLSVCSGARNYADYDHDYTEASDQEPRYIMSAWLIAIIVGICVVVVAIIVVLIVCCFCCPTRRASPNRIAHTIEGGTFTLTAITHQVYPQNAYHVGRTNAAFTPNAEITSTETGLQTTTTPPPYSKHPDIKP